MTEHFSADGYLVVKGGRFWDNNLRVVEVTEVAADSNPYGKTGVVQTWHGTTGGLTDTLDGAMRAYGRLARRYLGKDAAGYPAGTSHADAGAAIGNG